MAKNLKRGTFANAMYRKGVKRGMHTSAKMMGKKSGRLHKAAKRR